MSKILTTKEAVESMQNFENATKTFLINMEKSKEVFDNEYKKRLNSLSDRACGEINEVKKKIDMTSLTVAIFCVKIMDTLNLSSNDLSNYINNKTTP